MTLPAVGADDHVRGDPKAPLTLVEYGDYECPYCGEAETVLAELREQFGDRLRLVFRNFPLQQIHPYAVGAALVAEAAHGEGFWRLHDLLYANQDSLDERSLLAFAREAGVSEEAATRALAGATLDKVQRDLDGGQRSGVQGTPTFFVNGRLHEGEWRGGALAEALLA